jgi:ribulose-phosphate 3-epimerase
MAENQRVRIAPSLLASDFSRLGEQVAAVEAAGADMLHLDVMDGHFVPNITIGPVIVGKLRPHTKLDFDAHLMITDPLVYGPRFIEAGANGITFHIEVCPDPGEMIRLLRDAGVRVGLCLNPDTDAERVRAFIEQVDLVLVMTVAPGFGGQQFLWEVVPKIEQVRGWLRDGQLLQVDGGIYPGPTNRAVLGAGANCIVAGTAIFGADDPARVIANLRTGRED